MQPDQLAEIGFRVAVSDAIPEDTLVLLPGPRRATRVRRPDGSEVEIGETLEEYARRCVVVRLAGGPDAA